MFMRACVCRWGGVRAHVRAHVGPHVACFTTTTTTSFARVYYLDR